MTSIALTGIGELSTQDDELGVLHDATLVLEGGLVAWAGLAARAPAADTAYDLGGSAVVPGFVDSHSHLMFAGDRAEEFSARMTGTPAYVLWKGRIIDTAKHPAKPTKSKRKSGK